MAPRTLVLASSAPNGSMTSVSKGRLQSRQRLIQRQIGQRLSGRQMCGAEPLETTGVPKHSIGQAAEIRKLHIPPGASCPDASATTVALAELTDCWFHLQGLRGFREGEGRLAACNSQPAPQDQIARVEATG